MSGTVYYFTLTSGKEWPTHRQTQEFTEVFIIRKKELQINGENVIN